MNLRRIKNIDRFVGWALCFILHIYDKAARLFTAKRIDTPPRKILLIKFFGIGSIVLAQPMIKAVRQRYPDARLYFLTFSRNTGVLKLFGYTDEVLHTEVKPMGRFFYDTLKILLYLRRQKIDLAFDLEFFSRYTSLITYLSGAGRRIEFYSEVLWRGALFTDGVKFNPYLHIKDNFMRLAEAGGADINSERTVRPALSKSVLDQVERIFEENSIRKEDKKVCVNVNAGELAIERRWSEEQFIALLNKLAGHRIKLIMIGAKDDAPHVGRILARVNENNNIINLAGKTTLEELAGIFHFSDLMITSDSGPLHLADAVGTTTVSFFGPETPVLYGPKNPGSLVFYKALMCSPCLDVLNAKTVTCDNQVRCMHEIDVDEVYSTIINEFPDIFSAQEN